MNSDTPGRGGLIAARLSHEWAAHDLRHAAADALYAKRPATSFSRSNSRTTRGYLSPALERLADGMRKLESRVHDNGRSKARSKGGGAPDPTT